VRLVATWGTSLWSCDCRQSTASFKRRTILDRPFDDFYISHDEHAEVLRACAQDRDAALATRQRISVTTADDNAHSKQIHHVGGRGKTLSSRFHGFRASFMRHHPDYGFFLLAY